MLDDSVGVGGEGSYCMPENTLDDSGRVGGEESYCIPGNMLDDSVGVGGEGLYCMPENNALNGTGALGGGELCSIAVKQSSSGATSSSCTSCDEDVESRDIGIRFLEEITRTKAETCKRGNI